MNKINTLSAGYKNHPTKIRSTNSKPIAVHNPTKIDPISFSNKIKAWHTDGNLSTEDVNYIIAQLQTIV
tara:strand:- start:462 stop:668 length:207 start_codon:yes stop_codon:yes gene_type:complete